MLLECGKTNRVRKVTRLLTLHHQFPTALRVPLVTAAAWPLYAGHDVGLANSDQWSVRSLPFGRNYRHGHSTKPISSAPLEREKRKKGKRSGTNPVVDATVGQQPVVKLTKVTSVRAWTTAKNLVSATQELTALMPSIVSQMRVYRVIYKRDTISRYINDLYISNIYIINTSVVIYITHYYIFYADATTVLINK